jgi:hypothetical protein
MAVRNMPVTRKMSASGAHAVTQIPSLWLACFIADMKRSEEIHGISDSQEA